MAAVIGDLVSDPTHFHAMIATPAIQHQHSHPSSHYQTASSRPHHHQPRQSSGSISRRYREDATSSVPRYPKHAAWEPAPPTAAPPVETSPAQSVAHAPAPRSSSSSLVSIVGPSRIPSPPSSTEQGSTPRQSSSSIAGANKACVRGESSSSSSSSQARAVDPATIEPVLHPRQQPSPTPEGPHRHHVDAAASPRLPAQTINVRDLAHIQNLARAELVTGTGTGILDDHSTANVRYEISGMPIGDIIEMVAALLHKMTAANDLQHDAKQRNVAHQQQAILGGDHASSPMSASVLSFHGKNIPAISILSYLSRIHKYCPTTYEVFLSLLVYFDRMTERVNRLVTDSERRKAAKAEDEDRDMRESGMLAEGSDIVDDDDDDDVKMIEDKLPRGFGAANAALPSLATYFVVDSFNIHRLIIAGVTCASKFFSDVFYTNSRYAKVGGLPLAELNHLELQFLILNDFRLHVDVETLEEYATMLVEFYAREIVAHRSGPVAGME